MAFRCHRCQTAWESPHRRPGRTEACVSCGADLSCCRNCRFYAPGAPNDCAEPNAERVLDKDKANFCDFFEFNAREAPAGESGSSSADAHQRFDDLFKN